MYKIINESDFSVSVDLEKYNVLIDEIEESCLSLRKGSTYYILFNSTISFVNPAFIILLYGLYERVKVNNIKLLIDITNISDPSQHAFLNHIQQFVDYKIIKKEHKVNLSKEPIKTDLSNINTIALTDYSKILVYYATQLRHYDIPLNIEKNYSHLPVVKITNNEEFEFTSFEYDKNDYRKNFYQKLQIIKGQKHRLQFVGKGQNDDIWTLLFSQYLNLYEEDVDTIKDLQNILFEATDNIKKHTEVGDTISNGFLSFYKNTSKSLPQNEFFICDDYEKGFLETYLETMHEEKLEEQSPEALEEYDVIIKLLEADEKELEKYKEELELGKDVNQIALEKIFSSYYTFSTQKKRMVKHFGIPLLLKVLIEMNKNCDEHEETILKVYVHRGKQSYCVIYRDGVATAKKVNNTLLKGTYLYISFPLKLKVVNQILSEELRNIDTTYYKDFFKHKDIIKSKCDEIQEITINDLKVKRLPQKIDANKKISIIVNYDGQENISDFLRYIYSYAYLRDSSIKDIIVSNFNIKTYVNYLHIYKESALLENISNILFLDYSLTLAMFIGGKSPNQMFLVNEFLSQNYNYDKTSISNIMSHDGDKEIKIDTNLFFDFEEIDEGVTVQKTAFLPLDLFKEINDRYLYTYMIDNTLNIERKKYHVDIGGGKHISSFYLLKNIFEDSTWIGRLSFHLARYIKEDSILIGVESYASLIIDKAIEISGYKIDKHIIYDVKDEKSFKKYVKKIDRNKVLFFCPVIADNKNIKDLIKLIPDAEKYSAIKLKYNGNSDDGFVPFFTKGVDDIISNDITCPNCFGSNIDGDIDIPLYSLDENGFALKNMFTDDIESEKQTFNELRTKKVDWTDSIYFGHIERGNNHYLYYTKTLLFLNQNRIDIEEAYTDVKDKIDKDSIPVILTPLHQTNNEFVLLVDKVVFNNDATIHYFGSLNKKQKHKTIQKLKEKYRSSSSHQFYFVDDEISSGGTIKDFYKLLKNILGQETLYTGIFSLINRSSRDDEDILQSFSKKDNFYIYKNLNINPIKTEEDSCYLCDRQKDFKELTKKSSLVFIKNQFRKRAKDLEVKDSKHKEKTSESEKDIKDFKNFLKMFAAEYIHNNIENIINIEDELDNFKEEVQKYFDEVYLRNTQVDKVLNDLVLKMLNFEAEIAFVKALYFPNVSYYIRIRELVHQFVIFKLKEFRRTLFNISEKEIKIKPTFSKDDLKVILEYKENKRIKNFILFYIKTKKTNIDEFNFYIITSAYLNINYILDKEMIEFYYCLSKKVRDMNLDIKLLHKYPVAVKMLISYSSAKANYFNEQLKKFTGIKDIEGKALYQFKYTKNFSLINALYVENNLLIENKMDFSSITKLKNQDLTSLVNQLKDNILLYLSDEIKDNKISFFIDTNPLEEQERLIDIFDGYTILDKNILVDEYNIYKGVASDKDNTTEEIKIASIPATDEESKNNIWCNYYDIANNKTIIRITRTSKNKLKFKAIGVLVIYHKINSLALHLNISRKILKNQECISKFVKEYILDGVIAEKENRLLKEHKKRTTKSIEMINHTYRKYNRYSTFIYNIIEEKDNLEDLLKYSKGIEYNAIIGSVNDHLISSYKTLEKNASNRKSILFSDNAYFTRLMKKFIDFLSVSPKYLNSSLDISLDARYELTTKIEDEFRIVYYRGKGVKEGIIESVLFELIFNVIKNNKNGSKILLSIDKESIYIENTGEKIPEKSRLEIFKPEITYNDDNSFGLGLAAIKVFLELLDMEITCIDPFTDGFDCCFKIYKRRSCAT